MDYIKFTKNFEEFDKWNKTNSFELDNYSCGDVLKIDADDRVNSPSHYTSGKQEAIDIIEDAIQPAPSVETGFLQGQVLKYLLRIWLKDNPVEDAKKARWYLDRLISKLS